ncbi:MAG: hypothetical protein ACOYL5_02155 [Phototrophicaceae bacterium]|jgi:hypothetical protein
MTDSTQPKPPSGLANRPRTGLAAWEATIGYINQAYSPDALLTLNAYPHNDALRWAAMVEWGSNKEQVKDSPTLPAALRDLWERVEQGYVIFLEEDEAIRKPSGYGEFNWLDADTRENIDRLLGLVQTAFKGDWTVVFIYQSSANPQTRVQARLIARNGSVNLNGRGASLPEATSQLYRNVVPFLAR